MNILFYQREEHKLSLGRVRHEEGCALVEVDWGRRIKEVDDLPFEVVLENIPEEEISLERVISIC